MTQSIFEPKESLVYKHVLLMKITTNPEKIFTFQLVKLWMIIVENHWKKKREFVKFHYYIHYYIFIKKKKIYTYNFHENSVYLSLR